MIFRVNDSSFTNDTNIQNSKFQITNQRLSNASDNPLLVNFENNNGMGISFNQDMRRMNTGQSSLSQSDSNYKQPRVSVSNSNQRGEYMNDMQKVANQSVNTNSENRNIRYNHMNDKSMKGDEYGQSTMTESNRDSALNSFEPSRKFSLTGQQRMGFSPQVNLAELDATPKNNVGSSKTYAENVSVKTDIYQDLNKYSKSDKDLNQERREAQGIYPVYTNATGSIQFIKLRETSQQQMLPIPYDLEAEEAEIRSKHLEEDLLNSNAQSNNDLIFSQKRNTSTNLQLSHHKQSFLKESQNRFSLTRDNNQSEMRGPRHSVSSSNNPLMTRVDDKKSYQNQQYQEYHYESGLDSYHQMNQAPLNDTINQSNKPKYQIFKQKSHSVDHNVLSNNLNTFNQPILAQNVVNNRPPQVIQTKDSRMQNFSSQNNNEVDYKALYEQEVQRISQLEAELQTANDRIKKLKTEKVSLIQNYEKLIKKLHSMKQAETEYTKAMVEKNKLEEEVSYLENRVTKVKDGHITDSIMESLRFPVAFNRKEPASSNSRRDNNQRPIISPKSMEMGTQMSVKNDNIQLNSFVNTQKASVNPQANFETRPKVGFTNDKVVRSQSLADIRHSTGRIVKDLDSYMNALESNVCEVILDGQKVYDKRNSAKKVGSTVKQNVSDYNEYNEY